MGSDPVEESTLQLNETEFGRSVHALRQHGESPIERSADPVILTGDDLDLLIGRNPAQIVAFRYDKRWKRIPIQVDERVLVDLAYVYGFNDLRVRCVAPSFSIEPSYADPKTFTGPDTDPRIDADDEVVFMYRDAGKRHGLFREPKGVIPGSGIEVRLSDGDKRRDDRYIYIFVNDGSLETEANKRYGQYDFSLNNGEYPLDYSFCSGPNPEDSWFKSSFYERHFTDRWLSDVIRIFTEGSSPVDILDAHYTTATGLGSCATDSGAFANQEGAFATIKEGPVRSIRSYLGAQSGPFTQRTHIFYEQREDIIDNLRVHSMGGEILDGFDYSKEAVGMKYYNPFNPEGILIDGLLDEVRTEVTTPDTNSYENSWSFVTGPQGTMLVVSQTNTNIEELESYAFFRDEAPAASPPCQGDDSYYGISGTIISNTPCVESFCPSFYEGVRSIYYLEPSLAVEDAVHIAENIYTPLEKTLKPKLRRHDSIDAEILDDAAIDGGTPIEIDNELEFCKMVTSIDSDADGQDDEKWISYSDHGGNRIVEELDDNADGIADGRWTMLYENQDRLVTDDWDNGADGTIEARRVNTYNCYPDLQIIWTTWQCDLINSETDTNGDGLPEEVWFLEYEDGILVEESLDQDGDGVIDQRWTAEITSDEWGMTRLIKATWDEDGDGSNEEVITQEWNDSDNVTQQFWDKDGDNVSDEHVDYVYDENGYMLVEVQRMQGEEKLASLRWEYQFGDDDWRYYIQSIEADENGDDITDTRIAYQYDGWTQQDGLNSYTERQEVWYTGDNPNPTKIITIIYDEDRDNSVKYARDEDADGTVEEFCTKYDNYNSSYHSSTVMDCDTDGDQLVDWSARQMEDIDCKIWHENRFDDWIIFAKDLKELPTSPTLAKERAYRSQIAPVFDKVHKIGTEQSIHECYNCRF